MYDTELNWLWKQNYDREKKRQLEALKDGARQVIRKTKPRKRELKTLDKARVTIEEVKSWERFPLLRRRLHSWPNVLLSEVLAKFGESPVCFFTGFPIDYEKTETYHLDHIVPKSKGGPSTLENMQLVNPVANVMKRDFPVEEFLCLCRLIAKRHPAKG